MKRDFLDLDSCDSATLKTMLDVAEESRQKRLAERVGYPLKGKTLGMIFEKSSTRTRVSFDVGMKQLGGDTVLLSSGDTQIGRGETIPDTARVLSRYVDLIMIRTTAHNRLLELAEYASVPVINGLTDFSHPCQIMADMLTWKQHHGEIEGKTACWLGDGNNVAVSWIHAAAHFNFTLRLACPEGLMPDPAVTQKARAAGADIVLGTDPAEMAAGADVLITDTWVSMGDEVGDRYALLEPYQVNDSLMGKAKNDALFMHCLPAHRGEEVTNSVMDGPHSVVWDEAENRLHAQKAVMLWCLGEI